MPISDSMSVVFPTTVVQDHRLMLHGRTELRPTTSCTTHPSLRPEEARIAAAGGLLPFSRDRVTGPLSSYRLSAPLSFSL